MSPMALRALLSLLVTLGFRGTLAINPTSAVSTGSGRLQVPIEAHGSSLEHDIADVAQPLVRMAPAFPWFADTFRAGVERWKGFLSKARAAAGAKDAGLLSMLQQMPAALIAQPPQVPGKSPLPWHKDGPSELHLIISVSIWAILVVLVANMYVESKQPPPVGQQKHADEEAPDDWEFALFSCIEDPQVALGAMFCPSIRWAETLSYVPGFLSFWAAFFVYLFIQVFSGLTAGTLGWILLAVLCTAYRQEMRIRFGLRERGGRTYVLDCIVYCCCSCCAIAQEARHVKEARRRGHKAAVRLSCVDGIAPSLFPERHRSSTIGPQHVV